MRMFVILVVLFCGCLALQGAPPKKPPREIGPREIDFSPLKDAARRAKVDDYEMTITIDNGLALLDAGFSIQDGTQVETIRDLVMASLQDTPRRKGSCKVKAIGTDKLLIEQCNDRPIVDIRIKVTKVAANQTPTVRRIKEKEKEAKKRE